MTEAGTINPMKDVFLTAWFDERRDILSIKIKSDVPGEANKTGVKIRITEETLRRMDPIPAGGEYPEYALMPLDAVYDATQQMEKAATHLQEQIDKFNELIPETNAQLKQCGRIFAERNRDEE